MIMFSNPDSIFIFAWAAFVFLVFAAITIAILWAAKTGQFDDQDRARYLPLMSGIPEENEPPTEKKCIKEM
jgi:cbb3-type cytochrome oxidase maturation protein